MPLSDKQRAYLHSLDKTHIHGKNMLAKHDKASVEVFYTPYRKLLQSLTGSLIEAVSSLNQYKDFVHEHSTFSSQSKFASSIIEEFLCQILKARFGNGQLSYGSVKAYSSLYFSYLGAKDFKEAIELRVNVKDQDVGIFREEVLTTKDGREYPIFIPLVCIECKTYLDKTMYEGSVATASKIKSGNPHCQFFIVTETYDVSSDVEIGTSQIDNIYVLRKRRRKADTSPIQVDVLESLLESINTQFTHTRKPVDRMITDNGYIRDN